MFLKNASFALLLILGLQCSNSPHVSQGQDKLGIVNFPEWFIRTDTTPRGGEIAIAAYRYEVRKLSTSSPGELIFGARDNDGELGSNFFASSLDGQFNVRSVSAEEWSQAEKLSATSHDPYSTEIKATVAGAQYRGKTYAKTGDSWERTAALPSPDGRWIVVFSHTSEKDKPSYGVMGGGGLGKGEMFIDVYDTASGEKVLSGHAPHAGGDRPGRLFNNTFWAGSRYLIVPLYTKACFLGVMPSP